jgi:hypothetical protein
MHEQYESLDASASINANPLESMLEMLQYTDNTLASRARTFQSDIDANTMLFSCFVKPCFVGDSCVTILGRLEY